MGRQSSRARGTRPSVSGTRSRSARVARRVARVGLTTGGSSDDTMDWTNSRLDFLFFFRAVCHGHCSPFLSLVLWILALRSDILSPPPYLTHFPLPPPKPAHASHLYPAIPLSRHATHTYYTVHTTHSPRTRQYSLHTHFFPLHPTVSHSLTLVPSRSVLLHSLFPVCPDRFALIISFFASSSLFLSLSSALAFVDGSICALF